MNDGQTTMSAGAKGSKAEKTIVSPADIADFARSNASDFAFEMECLRLIEGLEFDCRHGGTYVDPILGKNRQFDIRAEWQHGASCVLAAVECKNLTEAAPLLVMTMPRDRSECFHYVLSLGPLNSSKVTHEVYNVWRGAVYREGDPVGKDCLQIAWSKDGGQGQVLKKLDTGKSQDGVYDKWSQALASLEAAVDEKVLRVASGDPWKDWLLLPIVVVPNGQLWMVRFDEDGNLTGDPERSDRCSYFVKKELHPRTQHGPPFYISHIEFVTVDGLKNLLTSIVEDAVREDYAVRHEAWFSRA